MNKTSFFACFIGVAIGLLSSCSYFGETTYEDKEVDDLYSIRLPEYLAVSENLNADASFQYQNENRDFCIVIRYDQKEILDRYQPDFSLEDFFDVSLEQLQLVLEDPQVPEHDSLSLHGNPCFLATINGVFKGDPLTYRLAVVEGENHIFQLLTWTLSDLYPAYEEDMNRILQSFEVKKVDSL